MDVLNSILASPIITLILQGLLILVILVVLDLIFGILAAVKQKQFQWTKVGDFYQTKVVPQLGGWLILVIAARASLNAAVPNLNDQSYNAIFEGGAGIAWGIVVGNLVYSIGQNFFAILGIPLLQKKE